MAGRRVRTKMGAMGGCAGGGRVQEWGGGSGPKAGDRVHGDRLHGPGFLRRAPRRSRPTAALHSPVPHARGGRPSWPTRERLGRYAVGLPPTRGSTACFNKGSRKGWLSLRDHAGDPVSGAAPAIRGGRGPRARAKLVARGQRGCGAAPRQGRPYRSAPGCTSGLRAPIPMGVARPLARPSVAAAGLANDAGRGRARLGHRAAVPNLPATICADEARGGAVHSVSEATSRVASLRRCVRQFWGGSGLTPRRTDAPGLEPMPAAASVPGASQTGWP
jgi:hypothetical protein